MTLQVQVDIVLTPVIAYNVNTVHAHSTEVISAHCRKPLHAQPDFRLCSSYFSGVSNMMVVMSSAFVTPATERWGVLVVQRSQRSSGRFYVLILFSLSNRCPPFGFFITLWLRRDHDSTPSPSTPTAVPRTHTHCGASMKRLECNTVLMTSET